MKLDKFNLPNKMLRNTILDESFQKVSLEDIKRVSNTYFKKDNLRIVIVGKGQEVISSLEGLPYDIKYFDKNGNISIKPDYSVPTGITAESVLLNYLMIYIVIHKSDILLLATRY